MGTRTQNYSNKFLQLLCRSYGQGNRIKTTKYLIGDENVDEPCKGDTPS